MKQRLVISPCAPVLFAIVFRFKKLPGSLSGIIENAVIPALGKYKHFLPVFRKSCQECEAIFTCGGGCYWESGECDKSCDIGYCQYSKILHAWMLGCLDKQATE